MITPRATRLSDGTRFYEWPPFMARVLHPQVLAYFTPALCQRLAQEDPVVFDVGANLGLFSVEVLRRTKARALVYAFEPIPDLYDILAMNVQEVAPERVRLFKVGLGASVGRATFSFLPLVHMASGCHLHRPRRQENEEWIDHMRKIQGAPWTLIPKPLLLGALRLIASALWLTERRIDCPVSTISAIIDQHGVRWIDVLKIDVEKAEWDVLHGIRPEHWPRIGMVVVEVHDQEGRLDAVRALFHDQGFDRIETGPVKRAEGPGVREVIALRRGRRD